MDFETMQGSFSHILNGRKFKKIQEVCFNELRERYGLKQIEVEILLFLNLYPDAHASQIYKSLDLNKGYVSQALDRLCKNNLLCVRPDPEDGRAVCYDFLRKGTAVIKDCRKKKEDLDRSLLAGLSAEELKVMSNVAEKIEQNIRQISEAS